MDRFDRPTARERCQLQGALRLLDDGVDASAAAVHDVHRAISDSLDPLARAPGLDLAAGLHAGVRDGVYATVRTISRAVFAGLDAALERAAPVLPPVTLPGPLVGLLLGVAGDAIARENNPLEVSMHLRHAGQALPATPEALAEALPAASARLVVFVHGLACDESSWALGSQRAWGRPGVNYAALLAERHGFTALHVRYNSGLRIADNGRALAQLLDALLAAYPRAVDELLLVGHSMGGLVVRAACEHGGAWLGRVRDVFCLGSPHGGAPLEKLGAGAVAALSWFAVTRPIARVLDARSAGIKDLADGRVRDDLATHDPVPPAHVRVHCIAGSLPWGALARWALGDGLVRTPSATEGSHPRGAAVHLPGLGHLDLLNHPRVFAEIEATLDNCESNIDEWEWKSSLGRADDLTVHAGAGRLHARARLGEGELDRHAGAGGGQREVAVVPRVERVGIARRRGVDRVIRGIGDDHDRAGDVEDAEVDPATKVSGVGSSMRG